MKPIIFNTEMVRSILTGHKTVTRRVVKPQPQKNEYIYKHHCGKWFISTDDDALPETNVKAPYQTGSILYVRETWCKTDCFGLQDGYVYKANDNSILEHTGFTPKWCPSIHMPREAARIFLHVTDVRVERLQDITEREAEKEGLRYCDDICKDENWHPTFYDPDRGGNPSTVTGFSRLWDSTIKPKDRDLYGWEANPLVWVIEFERCEKPEEVHE